MAEKNKAHADKQTKSKYKPVAPAVEQACRILLALGENPGRRMSLTQICEQVGIHKSKGYSILNSLAPFNFVEKDPQSKLYSLGPGLTPLARSFLDRGDLPALAAPYMKKLALETESVALLAVISNYKLFIAVREECEADLTVSAKPGSQIGLTYGAHGKALVAFMKPDEREKILSLPDLHFYGPNTPIDFEKLENDFQLARKLGYATDKGEITTGINAVSSPIFNYRDELVACITLVGTFDEKNIDDYGKKIAEAAGLVSRGMGSSFIPGMSEP